MHVKGCVQGNREEDRRNTSLENVHEQQKDEKSFQAPRNTIKVYHRVKEDLREKNPFNSRAQYLKRWIWRFMEISSKEWEKRERSRQQLVPTYILGAP
ncbi:hypothetical protein V6N13_100126 [Hibiscus sabdariffa]|uniref:Uncharacterized protein n=1 Tax=Hibiscus sabdariffa TaxID=183260 RepID=A0ABR2NUE7_9ROSI